MYLLSGIGNRYQAAVYRFGAVRPGHTPAIMTMSAALAE
jgi:hypothetical protein